jgi:hypothetical protein
VGTKHPFCLFDGASWSAPKPFELFSNQTLAATPTRDHSFFPSIGAGQGRQRQRLGRWARTLLRLPRASQGVATNSSAREPRSKTPGRASHGARRPGELPSGGVRAAQAMGSQRRRAWPCESGRIRKGRHHCFAVETESPCEAVQRGRRRHSCAWEPMDKMQR